LLAYIKPSAILKSAVYDNFWLGAGQYEKQSVSRSTYVVDDANGMRTDSNGMRVLLILIVVGALATGIWKFVASDLVTAVKS
jgi:hypothetical protein